jgi:hypothetical protein
MTNSWTDIKNADLVLIMGGNAAEAHPCGFKWVTEAMQHAQGQADRGRPALHAQAAVADYYAPIRVGTDIAFLGGVINYLLSNNKIHLDYVKLNTDATFLTKPDFKFDNGFFSGYDEAKRSYDKASWGYQLGEDGFVKVDDTLQDPLCVYQQMKKHYAATRRSRSARSPARRRTQFLKVCEMIGATSAPDKVMTICYALGWTQHTVGSQNIRTMAMIQLLLGNMGRPGGGINALRGHANVQGITDMCAYSEVLSGYMLSPTEADVDRETYLKARTGKPLRPNQMAFTQNFPKWHTSLMKAYYGNAATKENDFAYDWIPKRDGGLRRAGDLRAHAPGQDERLHRAGLQPAGRGAQQEEALGRAGQAEVPGGHGPAGDRDERVLEELRPAQRRRSGEIQTEVFRCPTSCFAEETGSLHQLQPRDQLEGEGRRPAGRGQADSEIMARLFMKLRGMYAKDGGTLPEPVAALSWPYLNANVPTAPAELLREINGKALADVMPRRRPPGSTAAGKPIPAAATGARCPPAPLVKAGEQLPGFALLRDDGSTACGNWIYCGVLERRRAT